MAFKESPRFPDRIAFGAQGGPAFLTDVVTLTSGVEQRNENWLESRQEYEVSQAVQGEADFKEVGAFFRSVGGRRDGFRFKDWTDYTVTFAEGIVEDLGANEFQLQKRYISGPDETPRSIRKPVPGTVILRDGVSVLATPGDYTIDTTTGIITAPGRSAATLNWSGEFDVPVRFDVDKLVGTVINKNQDLGLLTSWDSIPLVEIRE